MKYPFLFAAFIFFSAVAFADPHVVTAKADGNWNTPSTWNQNQMPVDGDTIIIPSGKTVVLNSTLSLNNVYIKVLGTLQLKGILTVMYLDQASTIAVFKDGMIDGTPFLLWIGIGCNTVFYGSDIRGPQFANAGTGNGFMAFNNVTIPVSGSVLAVKFSDFSLTKSTKNILVQWKVENEEHVRAYEVERSEDGKSWQTIASITPSNSRNATSYAYLDRSVISGTVYYHIKQVDNDGSFSFSIVKMCSIQSASTSKEIKILATQSRVVLQFPEPVKGKVSVRFVTPNGQVLRELMLNAPEGQVVLNQSSTPHGNYFISVSNGSNLNVTSQVLL